MPLASPIGSGWVSQPVGRAHDQATAHVSRCGRRRRRTARTRVLTMETGRRRHLMKRRSPRRGIPVAMARAMRLAVEAAHGVLAGRMRARGGGAVLLEGMRIRDATPPARGTADRSTPCAGVRPSGARDGALAEPDWSGTAAWPTSWRPYFNPAPRPPSDLELATADPSPPRHPPPRGLPAARAGASAGVLITSVELAREMAGEGGARYVNRALRSLAGRRRRSQEAELTHPEMAC